MQECAPKCTDGSPAVQQMTLCSDTCAGSRVLLTRCPDSATPSSNHVGWFVADTMQCNTSPSCSQTAISSGTAVPESEDIRFGRWEMDRVLETGIIGSYTVDSANLSAQGGSSVLGTLSSTEVNVLIGCGAGCTAGQSLQQVCRWVQTVSPRVPEINESIGMAVFYCLKCTDTRFLCLKLYRSHI